MNKAERTRINTKRMLKNSAFIIIGAVFLALGVGLFTKPFNLVTGGVSGLSIALTQFLPEVNVNGVNITMEISTAVLTWVLFVFGLIFLGKSFALKTLLSSAAFTLFLPCVAFLCNTEPFTFFDIRGTWENAQTGGYALPIIAAVFGGVFIGFGCAITFRGGGSTGGLDIIALIIVKYAKRVKSSVMVFALDACVVFFGIFAIGDFAVSLIGVTSAFICATMIDKVFVGQSKAFIANIVSEKYEEIREAIKNKLDRTCTVISAKGGYTGEDRPLIMVSFTIRQYAAFITVVNSIDKNAFVTVHSAYEIEGEGFTKYDVRKKDDD